MGCSGSGKTSDIPAPARRAALTPPAQGSKTVNGLFIPARFQCAGRNLTQLSRNENRLAGDERQLKILLDDTRLPKVQKSRHDFEAGVRQQLPVPVISGRDDSGSSPARVCETSGP